MRSQMLKRTILSIMMLLKMQTTSTLVSVDVVIIAFTLFILNLSLVLINLTPVSEDPHSAVMADYTEFMNHKNIKTMANRRLAR